MGRCLGAIWDDAYDAATDVTDAIEDVGSSAIDKLSDAGGEIGAVFKAIAPFVALVPGFGTVLSVALSTAAALAMGDPLDQAIVDIAANAIPGGAPRVSFRAAADVTLTAAKGQPFGPSALRSMRAVAAELGGDRAVAAYDQGVAVAQGEKLGDATWKFFRSSAATGGPAVLAAFDAGVAVKNGEGADGAVYAAARSYLASAGGAAALAAFDTGIALARGQALQEAGFAGLHTFVAGNDAAERAVNYLEAMARAAREGRSVGYVLLDGLLSDVGKLGAEAVARELGPILERWDPGWGELGSYALAGLLGVAEPIARAAQAVMRDGDPDFALLERMPKTGVQSLAEKFGPAIVASRALNVSYTDTKSAIREQQLLAVARLSDDALSFRTARAEQGIPLPTRLRPPSPALELEAVGGDPARVTRPRTGVVGNLALGGTIALAVVALVWWSKSS